MDDKLRQLHTQQAAQTDRNPVNTETNPNRYLLEICANSLTSCMEAQRGGAHRVELCAAIPEGGTTPSMGEIVMARERLHIPLHVIIRPRGGDFLYSEVEWQTMCKDIELCQKAGVDGVVFGCLTPDGDIDMDKNSELIKAAGGMSKTFHRAFDRCANRYEALEKLIALGFDRVLTSGGQPTAEAGMDELRTLIKQADGRIIVVPGSGIHENNIVQIAQTTGAQEFHLSARVAVESGMRYRVTNFPMGGHHIVGIDEYIRPVTDAARVRKTLETLRDTIDTTSAPHNTRI